MADQCAADVEAEVDRLEAVEELRGDAVALAIVEDEVDRAALVVEAGEGPASEAVEHRAVDVVVAVLAGAGVECPGQLLDGRGLVFPTGFGWRSGCRNVDTAGFDTPLHGYATTRSFSLYRSKHNCTSA